MVLLPVSCVRVSGMFHLMCVYITFSLVSVVHITFSLVSFAEWPPFGK